VSVQRSDKADFDIDLRRGAGGESRDARRRCLEQLFAEQRAPLLRYLTGLVRSKEDAAEILQESFCRLVRQERTQPDEPVAVGYLFQTATNLARDYFRRRSVRCGDRHVSLDEAREVADGTCVETAAMWEQALSAVRSGLREMPSELRQVFVLGRFQGRSNAEIATALAVSTRTVERRMGEAVDYLVTRVQDVA
jgi:RNA polymerase sigma-70 factor (ECF subfamily)